MRTTVDIPDTILRRAKAAAALEGISLKKYLTQAVCNELDRSNTKPLGGKRVSLPLVRSQNPGSLELDTEKITQALDQEDHDAFA